MIFIDMSEKVFPLYTIVKRVVLLKSASEKRNLHRLQGQSDSVLVQVSVNPFTSNQSCKNVIIRSKEN